MNKTGKKILIGVISVIGIGIIGYFGFIGFALYVFSSGCGMDDGPFEAVLIDKTEVSVEAQQFDLSNDGKLVLDNRNDSLPPIIILIENGKVKWALNTDTRNTPGYESTEIWKISELTVTQHTNPIKLNFIAHWTYGAEAGSMEIDRSDGYNSFCLSW